MVTWGPAQSPPESSHPLHRLQQSLEMRKARVKEAWYEGRGTMVLVSQGEG
jgi:hypothetical protein